jgi:acetyl-CoA C-acetyltransferase
VDLDEWYLPTELAHGVLPAWLTFALLEQARWAAAEDRAAERRRFAQTMGRLNAVAAGNPEAWFHDPATGAELVAPAAGNRMVATPFTKRTTAFMDVDMAAANLLVTKQVADAWGVPDDRRAYLRGWGFARDAVHLAARDDLTSSPAMRAATARALATAGLHVDEVDLFDLYSCFGSAVHFAQDALGLAPDDPRPISVTGGLPYHGGPSSNYMGHAISHLVDRLRAAPDQVAMATGIGMHMTKHVAALWSGVPGALHDPEAAGDQRWDGELPSDRHVHDHHAGEVRLLAATVVHGADGLPDHAIGIGELDDGTRAYARTTDAEVVEAVAGDAWPHQRWTVAPGEAGTNVLRRSRPSGVGARTQLAAHRAG